MTYLKELPMCCLRFGKTEMTEIEIDGAIKNTVKMILICGYRKVEPEECIQCRGFNGVDTFIRVVKYKSYKYVCSDR